MHDACSICSAGPDRDAEDDCIVFEEVLDHSSPASAAGRKYVAMRDAQEPVLLVEQSVQTHIDLGMFETRAAGSPQQPAVPVPVPVLALPGREEPEPSGVIMTLAAELAAAANSPQHRCPTPPTPPRARPATANPLLIDVDVTATLTKIKDFRVSPKSDGVLLLPSPGPGTSTGTRPRHPVRSTSPSHPRIRSTAESRAAPVSSAMATTAAAAVSSGVSVSTASVYSEGARNTGASAAAAAGADGSSAMPPACTSWGHLPMSIVKRIADHIMERRLHRDVRAPARYRVVALTHAATVCTAWRQMFGQYHPTLAVVLRPRRYTLVAIKSSAEAYAPLRRAKRGGDQVAELMGVEASLLGAWHGADHHVALRATKAWVQALVGAWGDAAVTRDLRLERSHSLNGRVALCWKCRRTTGKSKSHARHHGAATAGGGALPPVNSGEAEANVQLHWLETASTTPADMRLARSPVFGSIEYAMLKLKGDRPPCVTCATCNGCTHPCQQVKAARDLERKHCQRSRARKNWLGRPIDVCEDLCRCKDWPTHDASRHRHRSDSLMRFVKSTTSVAPEAPVCMPIPLGEHASAVKGKTPQGATEPRSAHRACPPAPAAHPTPANTSPRATANETGVLKETAHALQASLASTLQACLVSSEEERATAVAGTGLHARVDDAADSSTVASTAGSEGAQA